ncbi:NAD(P)H-dependent oxidoreductase [Sporomusa sp. KB1]|jgi:multimeric flavodoxin WrbA|uniref:NAD(P)H-dependent oxidoreductase n=1 Tax=Sporomusa sp. KB1 TaxID=943346 RepID=UPI00119DED10|nr:NAD(P)H-dependent oxidoreductase [Sporomusa sp. KB1]TWH46206.1 NADPH-dependent FMN reductase [Sporomusa sp. KB1]
MKVVAINGNPRKEGNTYHALSVIGEQLNQGGIEFEIDSVVMEEKEVTNFIR